MIENQYFSSNIVDSRHPKKKVIPILKALEILHLLIYYSMGKKSVWLFSRAIIGAKSGENM
jgi:hypothetical protein